ncbi:MAG: polymer-forming cytoskeletal protein [Candidatus Aminicenantes bacterium]|nr:polymer-forming cytoskeletal protein [Candidatus Aminicenantes bacterium]
MKERKTEVGEIKGFLGEGTDFEGTLKFKDVMRIDGKFKGKIISQNTLVIGEPADVDAEIEVPNVFISGKVKGIIKAGTRLEMHSTARVSCDVVTPILVIEEGGIFQGNCQMGEITEKREVPQKKLEALSHWRKEPEESL